MNDEELKSLLHQWPAPPAPASLRRKVLPAPKPFWQGLFTGGPRFLLPLAATLCLIIAGGYWWRLPPPENTLSDFEPVTQFQPRIVRTVRTNHEAL